MSYEVDNPELKAVLKETAMSIKKGLPEGYGFMLMLFEFGKEGGDFFYMSDAVKEDAIKMMKDWIQRQETK